jgi:hypothetical protein
VTPPDLSSVAGVLTALNNGQISSGQAQDAVATIVGVNANSANSATSMPVGNTSIETDTNQLTSEQIAQTISDIVNNLNLSGSEAANAITAFMQNNNVSMDAAARAMGLDSPEAGQAALQGLAGMGYTGGQGNSFNTGDGTTNESTTGATGTSNISGTSQDNGASTGTTAAATQGLNTTQTVNPASAIGTPEITGIQQPNPINDNGTIDLGTVVIPTSSIPGLTGESYSDPSGYAPGSLYYQQTQPGGDQDTWQLHANGGLMALAAGGMATGGMSVGHLGGYSDGGRLLRGPGDGVSDSIPATIGTNNPEPARLADGEFVVPARIVSELGNGSTEAGARELYKMMARIQQARSKTTGKDAVATNTNAHQYLPA